MQACVDLACLSVHTLVPFVWLCVCVCLSVSVCLLYNAPVTPVFASNLSAQSSCSLHTCACSTDKYSLCGAIDCVHNDGAVQMLL